FTGPAPPAGGAGVAVRALSATVPSAATEELWNVLLGGGETQTEVALDRWDVAVYYAVEASAAGKTNAKHGAFLSNQELSTLDPQVFHLTLDEAGALVPEQRLVLRLGTSCLLEEGLQLEELQNCPVDTYLGDCSSESRSYASHLTAFHHRGAATAVTAHRLAYALGLRGESCAFDTACSSSLVALSHGHARLRLRPQMTSSGDFTAALVMGVRVMLGPDGFVGLGAGGFLGLHGRCLTFDSSANGFGRGEGCGAVLLGPPGEEVEMAALLGSAVNQDGRSASMTAPNGPSQQRCIRSSLQMAQLGDGASLSIMECHGTGTSLGDPIEIGAIKGVVSQGGMPLLTSSKTNIGHGEAAAGLNGFIKCVLMLAHSMCPANVHLRVLNGNLDTNGSNSQHLGVSSFGFGGTNARADLWGHCQVGPRQLRARLVVVPCPRCGQGMCRACGEVADDFALDFHRCDANARSFARECLACVSSDSDSGSEV
ncbi:unnamed protein product, partial [Cladocopium goreaui]